MERLRLQEHVERILYRVCQGDVHGANGSVSNTRSIKTQFALHAKVCSQLRDIIGREVFRDQKSSRFLLLS